MSQAARLAHWVPTYSPASGNVVIATGVPGANNVVPTSFGIGAGGTGTDPTKVLKAGDTMTGALAITNTTPSSSPTTGALTVAGGLGVGNFIFATAFKTPGTLAPTPTPMAIGYDNSTTYGLTIRPASDSPTPVAAAFFNAAGGVVGTIVTSATATTYNTSSDGRLKTDLQPFDAGPILDAITPWNFEWIAVPGTRSHGVIAQEVTEVYPEAVTHSASNDLWGVDYSRFVPLLLQEIKSLRARVAALETAAI